MRFSSCSTKFRTSIFVIFMTLAFFPSIIKSMAQEKEPYRFANQKLPQDHSFDRIEIIGHGTNGKIAFSEGSPLSRSNIHLLKEAKLGIAAENTSIRITSCQVGGNPLLWGSGEKFMTEIGDALLPKGGKIYASHVPLASFKAPVEVVTHSPTKLNEALKDAIEEGLRNNFTLMDMLVSRIRNPRALLKVATLSPWSSQSVSAS